jgi:transglutaminase-like putative cysteine protease
MAIAAKEATATAGDVVHAVRSVEDLVHHAMSYRPGTTEIGVDVAEVWRTRAGVCQDFAHLTVAMLRSLGIGARYVSGYFFAADPTAADAEETGEVVVATHAWVEVAIPGGGWWAIDPTNAAEVGERHIKIGHGRDYDDVTPLRGVYYGDTGHVAVAEVTMSTTSITHQRLPGADDATFQEIQQQ